MTLKSKNLIMRFRDFGFKPGILPTGKNNSISDVIGVKVGHLTKIEGSDIRTGITIIDSGIKNLFQNKIPAAIYTGNGFGKITGVTEVEELGTMESSIALTNTLAVGTVMRAMVDIVLKNNYDIKPTETINVIVGETNDGYLNDIHKNSISPADVEAAYGNLSENVITGNVGAGTGTRGFSFKGGIGTSSRIININGKTYTIGALVQTNFGGALTIMGVPIWRSIGKTDFDKIIPKTGDGSCMIVLATDTPLTARQLKRIAKRGTLALAKTGSVMAHGSGDYAICFSTSREGIEGSGDIGKCISDNNLTALFLAAVEAVEESIYEALFAAETLTGRDGATLEAIPKNKVIKILKALKRV